jgi:hypothetical protein
MPDRKDLAMKGILPYCDIRDSSLIPSLYRNIDSFFESLEAYELFIGSLGEWSFGASRFLGPRYTERRPWETAKEPVSSVPDIGLSFTENQYNEKGELINAVTRDYHFGLFTYQLGLVLQHYGCPTGWLDITSDPSIALWFALHHVVENPKRIRYKLYKWQDSDSDKWPTIFVFLLETDIDPFLDTQSILQGKDTLRPQRQKCGLLGGAGNLCRNYAARYIALKIRLAPGFKLDHPYPQKFLFPGPEEDVLLKKLLQENEHTIQDSAFKIFHVGHNK